MLLPTHVNTFGQAMRARFGEKVHKLSIHAGFTCPNIDGSKGYGGCTFCNNASFNPNGRRASGIAEQIAAGRAVIRRRTGARRYLAYFQAYTNTYSDIAQLRALYDAALAEPDVVGLAIGTRPDCVPDAVLQLLAEYQGAGYEIWLELGLQSADDATLARVNRGHDFAEYVDAVARARRHGLRICTHLIVGLPGEAPAQSLASLARVLELGVDGLKIHPLHVVRNTLLAKQWRDGAYAPLTLAGYVGTVAAMIRRTPRAVVFHRLTATAQDDLLLAPGWCSRKWRVLNAIAADLARHGGQGSQEGVPLWN